VDCLRGSLFGFVDDLACCFDLVFSWLCCLRLLCVATCLFVVCSLFSCLLRNWFLWFLLVFGGVGFCCCVCLIMVAVVRLVCVVGFDLWLV